MGNRLDVLRSQMGEMDGAQMLTTMQMFDNDIRGLTRQVDQQQVLDNLKSYLVVGKIISQAKDIGWFIAIHTTLHPRTGLSVVCCRKFGKVVL